MSSKIFKSAVSEGRLSIAEAPNRRFTVGIRRDGVATDMVDLAPTDAPALMQAIGECLPSIPEKVREGSYEAYMGVALNYLGKAVRALEAETAEAEAQAELEAEALELFKASGAYGSDRFFLKFSDLEETTQSAWLAVARRAREINKEEK